MFIRRKRTSKGRGHGSGGTQSAQSSPVSSSDVKAKAVPRSGEARAAASGDAGAPDVPQDGSLRARGAGGLGASADDDDVSMFPVQVRGRASHSVGGSLDDEESAAAASVAAISRLRSTPGWAPLDSARTDDLSVGSPSDSLQSSISVHGRFRHTSTRGFQRKAQTARKQNRRDPQLCSHSVRFTLIQRPPARQTETRSRTSWHRKGSQVSQNQIERLST